MQPALSTRRKGRHRNPAGIHRLFYCLALAALLFTGCSPAVEPIQTQEQQDKTMVTLGIDLQEGFDNEQVTIEINDKEVFRQEQVTTKMLLGYAETLTFQVPQGSAEVKISLPDKQIVKSFHLELEADAYLGVSLTPAGIETFTSDTPFYYQ